MSASLLGLPAQFEHAGTVYKVGPPNQFAKATLEELLAGAAVDNVTALKSVLSPAEYTEARDAIVRAVGSGLYRTGTKGWLEALQTPDGMTAFTLSLFRVNHPNMTRAECVALVAAAPEAVNAALARVVPDFFKFLLPGLTAEHLATITAAMTAGS